MKLLAYLLAIVALAAGAHATPNPYGIAGWGQLARLGMPSDCIDYDWNGLHPQSPVQMCRPNHYYEFIGIAPRWWGWNQNTGQINNPTQFATWVAANPGKIWIISNEPDLDSQDGLTKEQYAAMFKTYYDFIHPLDPSARFCIGAITGGSNTWSLNYSRAWYEYVLDYYKTTYGAAMPVDIWNIHSYVGAPQIEDPDQPIRDFVAPFVDWCHTVDNGRYAQAEVWITELPIGEWMGALNQDWIIWFAERYMPRLERAGISRWFWFVSQDSGEYSSVALVNPGGQVSALGRAYSTLANSYPNPVPPVTPFVPEPPPAYYSDDFGSGSINAPWMVKAGQWKAENGTLRQQRMTYPFNGETCVFQHRYSDFSASMQMRVNDAAAPENWVGVIFHLDGRFQAIGNSGYLVYMRRNGAVGLYNSVDKTVQEIPAAVPDASQWQTIRIQMTAWRIQIWVNGAQIIDWTDANHRWADGYIALQAYHTDSAYRQVQLTRMPNAPSVLQPAVTRSLDTLTASWSADLPPWGVAQTQYAIGTSPGGTTVRNWTDFTGSAISATGLSLSIGQRRYVSVRFKDSSDVWSTVGTGSGTTVVLPPGASSPVAAAKMKAQGETILPFTGVVSAGNDALGSYIYVQDFDRTSGIRVLNTGGVATGSIVTVAGKLGRVGAELLIIPTAVGVLGSMPAITPIEVSVRNLGGSDWPSGALGVFQSGVPGSLGLNNVGLLVSVYGRVTASRSFSLTVSDGSAWDVSQPPVDPYGATGVVALTRGLAGAPVGSMVRVTGVCSLMTTVNGVKPQLLIRSAADVEILAP